jgi:hypothetical protein
VSSVRFLSKERVESLEKFGYCACRLTWEERENYLARTKIDEVIHFSIDDLSSEKLVAARLIAEQEELDGGCTYIYVPALYVFRYNP